MHLSKEKKSLIAAFHLYLKLSMNRIKSILMRSLTLTFKGSLDSRRCNPNVQHEETNIYPNHLTQTFNRRFGHGPLPSMMYVRLFIPGSLNWRLAKCTLLFLSSLCTLVCVCVHVNAIECIYNTEMSYFEPV